MITIYEQKRTAAQNRKFYWLLSRIGVESSDRDTIGEYVYSWTNGRTRRTSEMTYMEMQDAIIIMETAMRTARSNASDGDMDAARKKVIRSIFAYAELRGMKDVSMDYVKAWACRAAGAQHFNDISRHRLEQVYHEFLNAQRALKATMEPLNININL